MEPIIRPVAKKDIPLLKDFPPPHWRTDMVAFLSRFHGHSRFHAIVLEDGGDIVAIGNVLFTGSAAWLGHIIVSPGRRREGLGRAVTVELMRFAQSRGCTSIILIATPEGKLLYETLGFTVETEYIFHRGPVLESEDTSPVVPAREGDLAAILDLDREASGEDRGFILEPYYSDGYVYRQGSEVEGFYLPGLGNGVIAARSEKAGVGLLAFKHVGNDRVSAFPAENRTAADFMRRSGIHEYDRVSRMTWGAALAWKPVNVYCRIAGYIG